MIFHSIERRRKFLVDGTVALTAWGTLAFGSNYLWASIPLFAGAAILGLVGLATPKATGEVPKALSLGLLLVAVSVALQTVPLRRDVLLAISPNIDNFLSTYDVGYRLSILNGEWRHPTSIQPELTLRALVFLLALIVFLLGMVRSLTRQVIPRLATGLTFVGLIISMIGIVQKPLYRGKIYGLWTPTMGGDPFGPFVNRNHFAGCILLLFPLGLGLLGTLAERGSRGFPAGLRRRVLWMSSDGHQLTLVAFAVLAMACALVLTLSRSGFVCFLAELGMFGYLAWRRIAKESTRRFVVGCLTVLPLIVVTWIGVDAALGRFNETRLDEVGRLAVWKNTLDIARDYPLVGTGINTYGTAMLLYQRVLPAEHLAQAHNDYLELIADGGMAVCIPILFAIGAFILELRRRVTPGIGSIYWIRAGAMVGIVAIALQSFVDFSLHMPGNAVTFVVLCGIALASVGFEKPLERQMLS